MSSGTGPRRARSDRADVLCFLALPAWPDVELDALTLLEGAVARRLDRRVVDEHIVAVFALNEAEALLSVEPLHFPCRHGLAPCLIDHKSRVWGGTPAVLWCRRGAGCGNGRQSSPRHSPSRTPN